MKSVDSLSISCFTTPICPHRVKFDPDGTAIQPAVRADVNRAVKYRDGLRRAPVGRQDGDSLIIAFHEYW